MGMWLAFKGSSELPWNEGDMMKGAIKGGDKLEVNAACGSTSQLDVSQKGVLVGAGKKKSFHEQIQSFDAQTDWSVILSWRS